MKRYVIATGTVTYAIKGRDLLRKKGFKVNLYKVVTDTYDGVYSSDHFPLSVSLSFE